MRSGDTLRLIPTTVRPRLGGMSLGRSFRVLWSANAASNLADGLAFVSPLLAASLTDDPRWVAGLSMSDDSDSVLGAIDLVLVTVIRVCVPLILSATRGRHRGCAMVRGRTLAPSGSFSN